MNHRYSTAKSILGLLSTLGWIVVVIGILAAAVAYSKIGIMGLMGGGIISMSGVVTVASAQMGMAQIETAENTYQILRKMSDNRQVAAQPTATSGYYNPPSFQQSHGRGKLQAGDRVKAFRGYEILKAETGCTVDGVEFDNILKAEQWINSQKQA